MAPDRPTADQDEADTGDELERYHGQIPLRQGPKRDGNCRGCDERKGGGAEDHDGMNLPVSGEKQSSDLVKGRFTSRLTGVFMRNYVGIEWGLRY